MDCDEPRLTPNEKTQPIQWTERPTGTLVAAGSLWLLFGTRLELSLISKTQNETRTGVWTRFQSFMWNWNWSGFSIVRDLQLCSGCDPPKILFTSKFSYVLFCNPTDQTETGTTKRWGTTNSKPPGPMNHYDGPIRNTEQKLDHIYYTLFCKCTARQGAQLRGAKTIFLSQTGICWIFFIQFNCAWSHT
jgi:hypothetical protein